MARPRKRIKELNGKSVVVYIRVSSEEQAAKGHFGPEAQRSACDTYIARKGYTVVSLQEDLGISGAKRIDERPGLAVAMALCESGAADAIVCYAQDRLARKASVFEEIRERAVRGKYRLETAREGQDLTTVENELSSEAMSFVSSIERKIISRRFQNGRRERSKIDGRGSSTIPYGYRLRAIVSQDDPTDVQTIVEIDPTTAPAVRLLLKARKTMTYQQVADLLNNQGYKTPRSGKFWTVGHVQGIERHKELYTTGIRRWDGVQAAERWPVIMK